jgi:hypothetical protein
MSSNDNHRESGTGIVKFSKADGAGQHLTENVTPKGDVVSAYGEDAGQGR